MNTTASPYPGSIPVLDQTVSTSSSSFKRISWAAVFAGALIAMVVQLLLTMLGTGIGMSTVDPMTQGATPDASSLGIGAVVWWIVSSIVALFAGGWTAGHLAGVPNRTDSMLHGVLTWSLATLVAAYLLTSAIGSVVRGASTVVGGVATVTAAGATAAAGPAAGMIKDKMDANGIDLNSLKAEANKLLMQTGKPALQPGALDATAATTAAQVQGNASNGMTDGDFSAMIDKVVSSGQSTLDQVDKDALVNVVMSRTGVSREEATRRVDGWQATATQARAKAEQMKTQAVEQAKQAADATAKATSRAAFAGFVALLVGAIAAAVGGALSVRHLRVRTARI